MGISTTAFTVSLLATPGYIPHHCSLLPGDWSITVVRDVAIPHASDTQRFRFPTVCLGTNTRTKSDDCVHLTPLGKEQMIDNVRADELQTLYEGSKFYCRFEGMLCLGSDNRLLKWASTLQINSPCWDACLIFRVNKLHTTRAGTSGERQIIHETGFANHETI